MGEVLADGCGLAPAKHPEECVLTSGAAERWRFRFVVAEKRVLASEGSVNTWMGRSTRPSLAAEPATHGEEMNPTYRAELNPRFDDLTAARATATDGEFGTDDHCATSA
jgi:hypothetical protein